MARSTPPCSLAYLEDPQASSDGSRPDPDARAKAARPDVPVMATTIPGGKPWKAAQRRFSPRLSILRRFAVRSTVGSQGPRNRRLRLPRGPMSETGLGRVKTPTFNLRVEIPSRFRKFENQKCLRPLLREDNRENNSAHSWLVHVFTQPGSDSDLGARRS